MSLTVSPIKGEDALLYNGFKIYISCYDGIHYSVYRHGSRLIMFRTLQEAVAWCED